MNPDKRGSGSRTVGQLATWAISWDEIRLSYWCETMMDYEHCRSIQQIILRVNTRANKKKRPRREGREQIKGTDINHQFGPWTGTSIVGLEPIILLIKLWKMTPRIQIMKDEFELIHSYPWSMCKLFKYRLLLIISRSCNKGKTIQGTIRDYCTIQYRMVWLKQI